MISYANSSDKSQCYGCRGCEQVCPVKCITMKEDEEGFLYPVVDMDTCIHCNACERSCPYSKELVKAELSEPSCYGMINKDAKVLESSSSGGVFYNLAKYVIEQGGTVFGVAMANDFSVKHIAVDKLSDIPKIQGSKYVQSNTGKTYQQTEALLKEGKFVLYSGTPCQIAGLRSFLKKDYDRLYTVDLICHGVPSNKSFVEYINYLQAKKGYRIKKYEFRSKRFIGCPNEVIHLDSKVIHRNGLKSLFALGYNSSTLLRESCFTCKYASTSRAGDITLGDFWGIERYNKRADELKGVSAVLANTKKGLVLITLLSEQFEIYNVNCSDLARDNGGLDHPVKRPAKRDEVYKKLSSNEYPAVAKEYFYPSHYVWRRIKLWIPIRFKLYIHKHIITLFR